MKISLYASHHSTPCESLKLQASCDAKEDLGEEFMKSVFQLQ